MITKNFKKILGASLVYYNAGYIPVVDVSGSTRYTGLQRQYGSWPYDGYLTVTTLSAGSAGISVGSGTSPESDDSYQLESTITSGLTLAVSASCAIDQDQNSVITRLVTVTNTSDQDITIAEIGQKIQVRTSNTSGGTTGSSTTILADRTVLDTPITVPAGASATITYEIKFIWNSQ